MESVAAVAILALAFGLLAGGRLTPLLYAGQCATIALAAVWQAAQAEDWSVAAIAVVAAAQAAWLLPVLRDGLAHGPTFPGFIVGAGLLLVAASTAIAPAGLAVTLAVMLVGLLGAVTMPGPVGVLCLLNGAMFAVLGSSGLPLRPLLAGSLAGLAVLVAGGGVRWPRLRPR